MNIDQILNKIYPLSDTSKELLKKSITAVNYKKGHILLRADKIEKNSYFIKKDIARAYSYKDDAEITFWFGKEGDTIISMKSYIANLKGYENIELLEDRELTGDLAILRATNNSVRYNKKDISLVLQTYLPG